MREFFSVVGMHTQTSQPRLHGLDAARAFALLLGIVLHSVMPFVPGIGSQWLVADSKSSLWALVALYLIHLFRMTLFMVLAGYFGRMVVRRRGTRAYLGDRARRILLPAIAFWPVAVLPLGFLAYAGARSRGLDAPPRAGTPLEILTPGQLWFLVLLFYLVVLTLAGRSVAVRLLGRERAGAWAGRISGWLASWWGMLLPAACLGVALALQGGDPGAGIIAPVTVVPEAASTLAYLAAFLTGWFLHAAPGSLEAIGGRWRLQLGLGLGLATAGFLLAGQPVPQLPCVALASWLLTLALLGCGMRCFSEENPAVRYLADASYWMYLMHLPLLVAIEIPLADLGWPILLKLAINWALTTALLLVSYHWLVRRTWVGAWLNGRRRA